MSRLSEIPEKMPSAAKMTSLKIDPRIRYLADLASTITKQSLTKYLEAALLQSFKNVTLRVADKPERVFDEGSGKWTISEVDPEEERMANEHMTIANQAELLWSESEYVRLLMLSMIAPTLIEDKDAALLSYIDERKDLRISAQGGYKLNREKIDAEWESIKADFTKAKGKVK